MITLKMGLETAPHLRVTVQEYRNGLSTDESLCILFPIHGWQAGLVGLRTADKAGSFPLLAS